MLIAPALHLVTAEDIEAGPRFVVPPVGGTIGSAEGNAVLLPVDQVRRVHARIVFSEGAPVVFRLHPEARVVVNGTDAEVVTLHDGDVVKFGEAAPLRVCITDGLGGDDTPTTVLLHLCAATAAIDGSREIDEVLARIADAAIAVTGADRGFIVRLHNGRPLFSALRMQRRAGVEWTPASFSRTVVEEALANTGPILRSFGSMLSDRPHSVALSSIGSALACAVRTRRGPIGVLYLDSQGDRGQFTDRDHTLLILLSNIAAIALAQAQRAQELAESNARLQVARRLVDFSPHALFAIDGNAVVYENPVAVHGPLGGIAHTIAAVLAADDEPGASDAPDAMAMTIAPLIRRAQMERTVVRERLSVRLNGHERVLEVRTHPTGHNDHTQVAVSIEDVTQGHEAEQLMARAERVASAEAVAGGIAHDFNNLLTVLRSGLDYLVEVDGQLREHGELVQDMRTAMDTARELTQRLMTFSRRRESVAGVYPIGPLLSEVADLARRSFGGRHTLLVRDKTAGCQARIERTDIQRALLNLLFNARDASALGQEIELRAEMGPGVVPGAPQTLRFSVVDHGCGVPLESRPRLFEPFFTTKGPDHGTGLGLASSRRIVRHHGGDLFHAETPGGGSTFVFTLPAVCRE
jgi:signal transduction histidine kinase